MDGAPECGTEWGMSRLSHLLLEWGANVRVANVNGWTALHSAAVEGHDPIARPLPDKGTDVSTTDKDGDTALFTVAFSGMKSMVEVLLKREADANATSMRLQFEKCE
jgi:ankyrin repeat protein